MTDAPRPHSAPPPASFYAEPLSFREWFDRERFGAWDERWIHRHWSHDPFVKPKTYWMHTHYVGGDSGWKP